MVRVHHQLAGVPPGRGDGSLSQQFDNLLGRIEAATVGVQFEHQRRRMVGQRLAHPPAHEIERVLADLLMDFHHIDRGIRRRPGRQRRQPGH